MTPSLPPGSAWRFGARQASFIVFLVVLLACAIAATTRPSLASAPVATRTPPRSAPAASPSPHRERSGTASSPAAPVSSVSAGRRPPRSPTPRDELARLASYGLPIYCGSGEKHLVALTFDDGPGNLTPRRSEEHTSEL